MEELSDIERIKKITEISMKLDILKIYQKKSKFLNHVMENVHTLWVMNEKPDRILSLTNELRDIENIFFDGNWKDIYYKKRSIWCTYCTLWKWCTVVLSYKCHRNCFFCYEETPLNPKVKINPYDKGDMDKIYELIDNSFSVESNKTLAITWWEPLLFIDKVYEILEYVNKKYPWKHKRIYTTWDMMTEEILVKLKTLDLDEIRYSIKPWEEPNLNLYTLSKAYIPAIVIEMPVMPDSINYMIDIITKMESAWSVDWINLNELTFNNINAPYFKSRWYMLDTFLKENDIYQRYFDVPKVEFWVYWSKITSLEILKYFSNKNSRLFLHYCDLNTVSHHHYLHKINHAKSLKNNYSEINDFWLHKILRIYWDIANNDALLKWIGVPDYKIFANYIETSAQYLHLLGDIKNKVIIYKDFSYASDVDFELI